MINITETDSVITVNVTDTGPDIVVINISEGGNFELFQDKSPELGGDLITNEFLIVNPTILETNLTARGDAMYLIAGENLSAGDLCYMDSSGKMKRADATSDATMPVIGIALSNTQLNATGRFLRQGFIRNDVWNITVSGLIFPSKTAGYFTQDITSYTTGNMAQAIGVAFPNKTIYFSPALAMVKVK